MILDLPILEFWIGGLNRMTPKSWVETLNSCSGNRKPLLIHAKDRQSKTCTEPCRSIKMVGVFGYHFRARGDWGGGPGAAAGKNFKNRLARSTSRSGPDRGT